MTVGGAEGPPVTGGRPAAGTENSPAGFRSTRWNRLASRRTVRVGDLSVTFLPDGGVQLRPQVWFPDAGADIDFTELTDRAGYLPGSIGAVLVEGPGRSFLVDTGYGPHDAAGDLTHPSLGRLFGGALPAHLTLDVVEQLDAVVLTHLHEDHIGWLTTSGDVGQALRSRPLIASAAELDANPRLGGRLNWICPPGEAEIFPGVRLVPTPGHTPGHSSLVVESGGERLICFGDVMHSCRQLQRPDQNSWVEHDADRAVAARLSTIRDLRRPGTIGFGGHFADVPFGRVVGDGDGVRWRPLP